MKSYNHLYEICISEGNRRKAVQQTKKSKRIRRIIRHMHLSDDALADLAYEWLQDYHGDIHTPVIIYDGNNHKQRRIIVPTLRELMVANCVLNAITPMIYRGMYEHSYASIPNRGAHKAKKVVEKWIRHDSKNCKYVLKMDIRHFYDTIDLDILCDKLSKKIHDEKMLDLIYRVLLVETQIEETDDECQYHEYIDGLPLGFPTSHWLANWYLQNFDHFVKEKLHAVHYVRYADDMVIFGSNKHQLHAFREEIEQYLETNLHLTLKPNWQVFRFSYGNNQGHDLDFMGFRFFRNRTILRKSILYRMTRKARRLNKKPKWNSFDARQMLSYLGYLNATDTYQIYIDRIKPYVNFKKFRRAISRSQKNSDNYIYHLIVKYNYGKGVA